MLNSAHCCSQFIIGNLVSAVKRNSWFCGTSSSSTLSCEKIVVFKVKVSAAVKNLVFFQSCILCTTDLTATKLGVLVYYY